MATVTVNGSSLGNGLQALLIAPDIQPGDSPGYDLCKQIYLLHPLGAKIVEKPLEIAQSQKRDISIPNSPESRIKEAFEAEWKRLGCDKAIFNHMTQSRIYGVASIAMLERGVPTSKPVDWMTLYKRDVSFNVYDPLNTAGSLVLNQDPMAMDFQHVTQIAVSGASFHRSRSRTIMNESPIYIDYVSSGFGFVGRSVYQRALFPLKSFVQTMQTDDMVAKKSGLLVAKMKQAGSIINNAMNKMFALKREALKLGETGGVLGIGENDTVESINLQNLEGPAAMARRHIIENIASAVPMPAKMLLEESFAEGFGEGTEDAKAQARFVDRIREQMDPLYDFFDKIVQHRAWNPEFYKTIQAEFPEDYGSVSYEEAFYQWKNSFVAKWPSLLKEPDSELVKVDEVKLNAIIAWVQVLLPVVDPVNKATLVQWACDNFNDLKLLFENPLLLDYEAIASYEPPVPMAEPDNVNRVTGADSLERFNASVAAFLKSHEAKQLRLVKK